MMRRRAPRHTWHLWLTIGTLGLWGPCWIITIIAAAWEPWRCRECKKPQPETSKGVEELESASAETMIGSALGFAQKQAD